MSINAKHRKHFKSGACLEYAPLERRRDYPKQKGPNVSSTHATSILTRPEYFERQYRQGPRTTQSMFGRAMSRVLGLFGRSRAAA